MKRMIFIFLAFAIGLFYARAEDDRYEDIADDVRDELADEIYYETDTMPGRDPAPAPQKKTRRSQPCIYDMPYSISANYPNYRRLAGNSALLIGGGLTTLGILQLLPEDATAWNKKEIAEQPMFERYYDHVIHGPHWDGDNAIFNYVLHPYAGAAYYMSARSQGFNMWYSWLYSFAVSTLFWEYGVEAFMEIPSWQDLIITPVGGLILGEAFYIAKRYIVRHDYRLLGWKPLGYVAAFLLDPVNEFLGYFRGNDAHGWLQRHNSSLDSSLSLSPDGSGGQALTLSMKLTF